MWGDALANTDWTPASSGGGGGGLSSVLGFLGGSAGGVPLPSITGGQARSGDATARNASPVTVGGSPFQIGDGNSASAGLDLNTLLIVAAVGVLALILVVRR
jgi:hypothetical protein